MYTRTKETQKIIRDVVTTTFQANVHDVKSRTSKQAWVHEYCNFEDIVYIIENVHMDQESDSLGSQMNAPVRLPYTTLLYSWLRG